MAVDICLLLQCASVFCSVHEGHLTTDKPEYDTRLGNKSDFPPHVPIPYSFSDVSIELLWWVNIFVYMFKKKKLGTKLLQKSKVQTIIQLTPQYPHILGFRNLRFKISKIRQYSFIQDSNPRWFKAFFLLWNYKIIFVG